ncbi:MAG: hypothetical protein EOO90_01905 [Pedobacter sp.]|nr:MAG: hypothetical protein EOO90_01905 [Pedobacter sp.]
MLDSKEIIKAINKAIEPFIMDGGSSFLLTQYASNHIFRLRIVNNVSLAFNHYGNGGEHVKVIKWFNDFWLFVEVKFLNPNGAIISLSVFQGHETDDNKVQLFRAEWDDYADGNLAHAQPHWHLLTNKAIENTVNSFVEIVPEIKDTFVEVLKEEKNKGVDLSLFHFAMYGDWPNNQSHIHRIDNENKLAQWFGGLLGHLKSELEYLSKKSTIVN